MELLDIDRIELRAEILREEEKREVLKVKRFSEVLRQIQSKISKSEESYINLKERICKAHSKIDLKDQASLAKSNIDKLRKIKATIQSNVKDLRSISSKKAKTFKALTQLTKRREKVAEYVDKGKSLRNAVKESNELQEFVEIESANKKIKLFREGDAIDRDEDLSTTPDAFEFVNESQNFEFADSKSALCVDINQGRNPQNFADSGEFAQQSSASTRFSNESFANFNQIISRLKSWNGVKGTGVSLNLTRNDGRQMQVVLTESSPGCVSVVINSGGTLSQAQLWAEKRDFLKLLTKSGVKVNQLKITQGSAEHENS